MIEIIKHPAIAGAYRLSSKLRLPVPRDELFPFFADAHNLEELTPSWLNFQVLTDPPIDMRVGALIDYRLKLHGFPIRWRTEISVWEPPYRFVDRQLKGPYRFWIHEHTFEEDGDATIALDQVDYAVPGGSAVHWLLVRRDVERIFQYRHDILMRRFAQSLAHVGH